jgi:hypothetical protein
MALGLRIHNCNLGMFLRCGGLCMLFWMYHFEIKFTGYLHLFGALFSVVAIATQFQQLYLGLK